MAEEVNSKREVQVHGTGRIVKNVLVISLAFMTQFTAYSVARYEVDNILLVSHVYAVYSGAAVSPILHHDPGGTARGSRRRTFMMSEAHSAISKITAEALLVRFLGIFFMIFHTSQIWGNLISSLGIYLACMAGAAIIVAVGVDPMKKFDTRGSGSGTGLSGLALLAATLKLLIEPNQILMIPINVFLGFQQAFFGADFTAAFVSCAVGTGSVGFVMMTYGLADAIGCIVNGYIAKIIDRLPLICIATIINIAILTTLLTWHPNGGQAYVLYIIIVVLGFSDSIWIVQINAYYSILFPGREEAAFSNFRLWESVGYIVAYVISPYLRTSVKTYLMLSLLVLGLSCYFTVEYRERRKKSKLNTPDVGCDNFAFQICEK
uniref:UNC93-like protein n=1 Tax=Bombyx mori TaxID=7091 RepID=A0A8R2LX74_BOMMO|nr:UNC93-like protein isoform X4 [Bombyx mori]